MFFLIFIQVPSRTSHEKVDIILKSIVQKGVKAFLEFCRVLDDNGRSHIVTEVMGLEMKYIKDQLGEQFHLNHSVGIYNVSKLVLPKIIHDNRFPNARMILQLW